MHIFNAISYTLLKNFFSAVIIPIDNQTHSDNNIKTSFKSNIISFFILTARELL